MIKFVLPAAVAAIALGTMAGAPAAQAQLKQPMAMPQQNPNMTDVNATISGQPGPSGQDYTESETYSSTTTTGPGYPPAPMPMMSPRTTWIPGHYNWDPATSNYVWMSGQYIEAPTTAAQWIPGHWEQTPTSWIWVEGGWR